MSSQSEEQERPYRVTRDGSIVDREAESEIGHVHRNDYGWHAELVSGARSTMHRTRRQACDSAWSLHLAKRPERIKE